MASFLTPWRWTAALLLLLLVGAPLVLPLVELVQLGITDWSSTDSWRVAQLFANTSVLVGGTLALAMPVGTALAILFFRTELPGRRMLIGLTLLMMFVPLPMVTSAWQVLFGSDGWLHWALWGANAGRPWTTGLVPAIWVHFLAGLPWVIFFVGMGLTWVERELEEEGLLLGPPLWVLLRVTLPRCRGTLVFAAVWLALQVAGEISVTDMMLVSTFAEEVQTQFSMGDHGGVARSIVAAMPLVVATWALLAWYLPRMHTLPPLQVFLSPPKRFTLGAWRWPTAWLAAAVMLMFFGMPLFGLLWKLGQTGYPTYWHGPTAWSHLAKSRHTDGITIGLSLLTAAGTGALVSLFALLLCWLAEECRWLRRLTITVAALAWSVPAPIIGIGLKDTIAAVVSWEDGIRAVFTGDPPTHSNEPAPPLDFGPVARAIYSHPSPVPLIWAYFVRFLPFAVAVLWPLVRLTPREPCEAARLEGHGPWHEFWAIIWPLTRRAVLVCGILVSALSLGEVAASTRVETPDWRSFANVLFDRMHYGVSNDLAALSILLLAALVGFFLLFGGCTVACRLALARNSRSAES